MHQWVAIGVVCCIAIGLLLWWARPKSAKKREGFQTTALPPLPNVPAELASQIDPCKVLKPLLASITTQIEKAKTNPITAGQLELMQTTKTSIEQQLAATNCP